MKANVKQKKNTQTKEPQVSFSFNVEVSDQELLEFLLNELKGKGRNKVKFFLTNNQVLVNDKLVRQYNFILKPGDIVQIVKSQLNRNKDEAVVPIKGFNIVFEDEHLIVINKNYGLNSIATQTEKEQTAYSHLYTYVKQHDPTNRIFIVHRLDRDTSGLMVFAKSEKVKKLLQENWKTAVQKRTYSALAEGVMENDSGIIQSYLHENKVHVVYSNQDPKGGKLAITHYKVIKRFRANTLLEINLETGRKNQIRVHLQDLGHPIVNDKKYGATSNPIGRIGLHAQALHFTHPITLKPLCFETDIPGKFLKLT